jgi:hypothetical protein
MVLHWVALDKHFDGDRRSGYLFFASKSNCNFNGHIHSKSKLALFTQSSGTC